MPFIAANDHITKYRNDRAAALNNERRMKWFTSDITGSMAELYKSFGSDDENKAWEDEYIKPDGDTSKMQAERLKVAFLAGCYRDLRIQFTSGKDDIRSAVDFDRYEYMRLNWNRQKQEIFKSAVQAKEKGIPTI